MKVIVTGSLGHISQLLAKALIQKGHSVTVISTNPEKQKDIEAIGATAAIGSVKDIDFLTHTFTGADAVYAMIPPNYAAADARAYYQETGHAYAQAIQQSGVKRVVHLSSVGADLDKGTGFILGSHDVEGILNELTGVSVTHLRPAYFYYNLYAFAKMIKETGFIGTNYGGKSFPMVAIIDIADAAAEELTSHHATPVRYISSAEHTGNEIAQILGAALGKPDLKWVVFTNEQLQHTMEEQGMPKHVVANFVELGSSIQSGELRKDYDLQQSTITGKVKLEAFAKEFAAAF